MKRGKTNADTQKRDSRFTVKKSKTETKGGKDPNKPKRPSSAFFVFMEDFRKQFKENHPDNKSVAAVGKAGGDKWKSMSEQEKAPFVSKAVKRKEDYDTKMEAYNKKLNGESDRSKSEEHNEGASGEEGHD